MALYEHVFLARQDLAQAQVDALAEAATKIVEDNQGKVVKTESWGLRSLAYRIAKNRKAHYVMLEIDAPGTVIAELERQTQINEDVIRYMTVRVDEAEAGPSVMMRKQERDRERRGDREGGRDGGPRGDRGDRGDRPDRAPRGYNYSWQLGVRVPTTAANGRPVTGTGTSFAAPSILLCRRAPGRNQHHPPHPLRRINESTDQRVNDICNDLSEQYCCCWAPSTSPTSWTL